MAVPGPSRPSESPRQRGWLLLYGAVTLAVAAAVAAALVRPETGPAGAFSAVAVAPAGASAAAVVQSPVHKAAPVSASAQRVTPARIAPQATAARSGQHSATAGSARATAKSEARARNSAPQATPGPVGQVLKMINQARAKAGLSPYKILKGLERSSARHNARMANGCGLSHQCPGEPSLGARLTAAGVHWTSAGENIGEGGPVANTQAAIAKMALALTRSMLNEKPPNDGHRKNILSRSFHHIGISVRRDSHGTVWMTQDFSN